MADDIFKLRWPVFEDGYRWVDATPVSMPDAWSEEFLVENVDFKSVRLREYDPLEHLALFRTFKDTQTTKDGILEFAREFGRLGPAFSSPVKIQQDGDVVQGESFRGWCSEIALMRRLVDLWDLARTKNVTRLSEYIKWDSDPQRVYYVGDEPSSWSASSARIPVLETIAGKGTSPLFETIAGKVVSVDALRLFQPGDVILPAKYYIQCVVNERLGRLKVLPRMLWDKRRKQPFLCLAPDNLVAALWVQFARSVDGDREYGRCQECRKWFELTAEKRTDFRFCSNPCRSRAYRKRQATAKSMHSEGRSIEEIAQHLNTDVKTAKGWVTK